MRTFATLSLIVFVLITPTMIYAGDGRPHPVPHGVTTPSIVGGWGGYWSGGMGTLLVKLVITRQWVPNKHCN